MTDAEQREAARQFINSWRKGCGEKRYGIPDTIPKKETAEEKAKREHKLATIVCLDPAAGSGNFLTETYLSLLQQMLRSRRSKKRRRAFSMRERCTRILHWQISMIR